MSERFTVVPDDLVVEAELLGLLRYRDRLEEYEMCPAVVEHESCVKVRIVADSKRRFRGEYIPSALLTEIDGTLSSISPSRERCEELIYEIKLALVSLGVPEADRWLGMEGSMKYYPFYIRYCPECGAYFYVWDWLTRGV